MERPQIGPARAVDETLFRFLVELEVAKAQRLRYCVSLICFAVDQATPPAGPALLAERFVDRIRSTDIIVPYPASSLTLLLVDAQPKTLQSIVRRLTDQLEPLHWSAGGATYPGTTSGADDLVRRALLLAARAQMDGGRQLYLPS